MDDQPDYRNQRDTPITPEQRLELLAKLAEFKAKFLAKHHMPKVKPVDHQEWS